MPRLLPIALSLALCMWAGTGLAAADALEAAYDNTIKITTKDGEELIYFNRDHTFTTTGAGGDTIGTWKITGDKICTKTKDAAESCGVIEPNRSVGDQWQHQLDGETVTIELVQGR